jgi:hypothetical protein
MEDHINLKVSMKAMQESTSNRLSYFVAHGKKECESLPWKPFDKVQTAI